MVQMHPLEWTCLTLRNLSSPSVRLRFQYVRRGYWSYNSRRGTHQRTVNQRGMAGEFSHNSTGGGSALGMLSGDTMPVIDSLSKSNDKFRPPEH